MIRQSIPNQLGIALISGLLLLLVITILGVGMLRSIGVQARIAGNTREKQRALRAASDAEAYAEWWISRPGGGVTSGSACAGTVQITDPNTQITDPTLVQVCSNPLTASTVTLINGPWTEAMGGKPVGFSYAPAGLLTSGTDAYFKMPMLYIAYLNGTYDKSSGTQTNNYLIDASSYGGTANTVAVVESTYQAKMTYTTQSSASKFYSLTDP